MKKILALPLLAMAVLASQAWGALMCLYPSGDCWPQDDKKCEGGWVYEGGTEGKATMCSGGTYKEKGPTTTGEPPTSVKDPIGCCNWNNKGCFWIFEEKEKSDCTSGGFSFYSGKDACPNDAAGTCPSGGGNDATKRWR